jgi:hypothetical protein
LLLFTFLKFSKIAKNEFSDIVRSVEIYDDRLKLNLYHGAVMEVRYRIDTAPHHPEIPSHPRHIHFKREDVIIEDRITSFSNSPEENFREVMKWVKGLLKQAN